MWRTFLLVAIAIATPFAIVFSLVGGLLGPCFVVLYALVPYRATDRRSLLQRIGSEEYRRTL